jgi:hypothetical protein
MNSPIIKFRRTAAVALAVAFVPFAASTASAAPKGKRATWTKAAAATTATTATTSTTTAATTASAPVTSVHAIGGYVFYNVSYAEAVELWLAAVAAAPAGYTPPPVTSVSVTTTVGGTVEGGTR